MIDKKEYNRIHQWLHRKATKSGRCVVCNIPGKTQWSNISGEYKQDLSDYRELCQRCHNVYDKLFLGKRYIKTKPSGFELSRERARKAGRLGGLSTQRKRRS